ncbi:hypothetical protein RO3G_03463 [Rhizopus delemar RA 99-880]|uniref:Uncharacterized protein n=1 Tax=Rhizopus delemar (strain RA 99-880 / ATCC MYA-4621 / FGSC 9543 / NRRL 43880) TaxID=246409 RepID=I1BRC8_RHIO9|nr:hypothetical protein RO3G_03463 [Rhizopus delemar RA 99-880]|eukprot:EIE78758.1 hypothetical protein RO3G_03463 [Rhizopus delemar RA 99-880]
MQLGTKWRRGVPIEVIPMALTPIQYTLKRMFPDANIQLRIAQPSDKAGPVVTDNDVGLFCNMAKSAYIGHLDSDSGDVLFKA